MGEGAGIVVLEAEDHAVARGVAGYAEVAGYGSSLDGYQVTAPEPNGAGATRAMKAALRDAALACRRSTTSTPTAPARGSTTSRRREPSRASSGPRPQRWRSARASHCPGISLPGCGGPEFVFTVLSVQRDEIHPTINLTCADPACDLDYVPEGARRRQCGAALSNSFGFGGQNACLAVQEGRTREGAA